MRGARGRGRGRGRGGHQWHRGQRFVRLWLAGCRHGTADARSSACTTWDIHCGRVHGLRIVIVQPVAVMFHAQQCSSLFDASFGGAPCTRSPCGNKPQPVACLAHLCATSSPPARLPRTFRLPCRAACCLRSSDYLEHYTNHMDARVRQHVDEVGCLLRC